MDYFRMHASLRFSAVFFGIIVLNSYSVGSVRRLPSPLPMTGVVDARLTAYDEIITKTMRKYGIPGGAVAVMRNGKLILSRGYGYLDLEQGTPAQPDTLFRIASVSKPITSVAILQLVESGRLSLDESVFDILDFPHPPLPRSIHSKPETATRNITVRQLLLHTGGWDRRLDRDIMFEQSEAANAVERPFPPSPENMISYAANRPLQHLPGTTYAYSNYGYNLLGRVIEKRAGVSYQQYVQAMFSPIGITSMRIGGNRFEDRVPNESRYYGLPGATLKKSRYLEDLGQSIDRPYHHAVTVMDAHGGWIASAIDLVSFAAAVDGRSFPEDILTPETIKMMVARPPGVPVEKESFYALGWSVRPGKDNWWHNGSLPGTSSLLVRTGNGLIWAGLFNSRDKENEFLPAIDRAFWKAYRSVKDWPSPSGE